MGEIADDIIDGACCALCGEYFVTKRQGNIQGFEHGYPVVCEDCWTPDCSYPKTTVSKL